MIAAALIAVAGLGVSPFGGDWVVPASCLAASEGVGDWELSEAPRVRAVLSKLESDYAIYDLCWSDHADEAREALASRIAEQIRFKRTLYIVSIPGVYPEFQPLDVGVLEDMHGRAIDHRKVAERRSRHKADLDAALADVLRRVDERRPGALLTLFNFQPTVDQSGNVKSDYPLVAERIRFVLQTPRTSARDASAGDEIGVEGGRFDVALLRWAADRGLPLVYLQRKGRWVSVSPPEHALASLDEGEDEAFDGAGTRSEGGSDDPADSAGSPPEESPGPDDGTSPDATGGVEGGSSADEGSTQDDDSDSSGSHGDEERGEQGERGGWSPVEPDAEAGGETWTPPSGPLDAEVDRRVTAAISLFNGDDDDPAGRGLSRPWREPAPAATRWLDEMLRMVAATGVRRIVLKLPFGSDGRMIADQFSHMDPQRRTMMEDVIRGVKRDFPDLEIGVYAGTGIDLDPSTPAFRNEWRPMDLYDAADRAAVLDMYRPIAEMGCDFVWLDAIAGSASMGRPVEWMAFIEQELGIDTYGEAFPTTTDPSWPRGPGGRRVGTDREKADAWRWMALAPFMESRNIQADPDEDHYFGVSGGWSAYREADDASRKRMIDDLIDDGFVPFVYHDRPDRWIPLLRHSVQSFERFERTRGR